MLSAQIFSDEGVVAIEPSGPLEASDFGQQSEVVRHLGSNDMGQAGSRLRQAI